MSLGVKQRRTFLNIREGQIIARDRDGNEISYDYVEGYLGAITCRDREFKGETLRYWYIDLTDQDGTIYSLGLPYHSGVAKAIFNSLASLEDHSKLIRIEPYLSGDYTKISVFSQGQRLPWKYPELPPVEEIQVGDRVVKDDSKRMKFFEDIVYQINTAL